jgi:SAM-dependent methyltransferase
MKRSKKMSLKRKLFFSIRYLFNPPWDTGITPPEVEAFAASRPPGKALDLGCGTGTNAVYLAQRGWQVTGVDFVARAIRAARKKARRSGVKVQFLVDDIVRLRDVSGLYDLILDIGCFHSLPLQDRKQYVQNVSRLLDPQGTYLLYAFIKGDGEDGPGIGREDLEQFGEQLELVEKQEGTDRSRTSAWLTWQPAIDPTPVQ